ncbi:hypothetical protein ACFYNM_25190 [Streptomyces spororaveus]|uniref:hypothetical protein n=1 Tax=Streptomyces spororaveus TaxID=284039 RepID=UPI00369AC170
MERDEQFIAYMKAFEASTRHLGGCAACQAEVSCETGETVHADFIAQQDAWNART